MSTLYTEIPKDHIRLLQLGPGSDKAIINAALNIVPLHMAGEYEALSYVWGKKIKKKAIRMNGVMVDATENLVGAMKHLRYLDRPRTLWIDALCINQGDHQEKSAQVITMGDIYSRAVRTVIWLGPADHVSEIALAFIRVTFDDLLTSPDALRSKMDSELVRRLGVDTLAIERRLAKRDEDRLVARPGDRELLLDIDFDEERGAVARLLQREWWTRVWIVQELCLGKEAVLVCGWSCAPWEAMTFAVAEMNLLDDGSDLLYRPLDAISRYRSLSATRVNLKASPVRPKLLDGLSSFRWFRATNPLDKVYALLSITDGLTVYPDYTLGAKECFENVARLIVTHSTDLDILDLVVPSVPLTSRDTPNLATWAPDWGQNDVSDPFVRGNAESGAAPLFDDEVDNLDPSKEEPILTSQARFDSEGRLVLRGILLDRISHLHGIVWLPGSSFLPEAPFIVSLSTARTTLSVVVFIFKVLLLLPGLSVRYSELVDYYRALLAFSENATTTDSQVHPSPKTQAAHRLLSLSMRGVGEPTAEDVQNFLAEHEMARPKWEQLLRMTGLPRFMPQVFHTIRGFALICAAAVDDDDGTPFSRRVPEAISAHAGRRPAVTQGGYLCFVPHTCVIGNQVALLRGGRRPYIVRSAGNERWEVVGPCCLTESHSRDLKSLWVEEQAQEMVFV